MHMGEGLASLEWQKVARVFSFSSVLGRFWLHQATKLTSRFYQIYHFFVMKQLAS